jgi:DNA polymerase elongation subunit (family B)
MEFQVLQVSSTGTDKDGPLVYVTGRSAAHEPVVVIVRGSLPHLCVKLEHGLLDATGKPRDDNIELLCTQLDGYLNTVVPSYAKYRCFKRERGLCELVRQREVITVHDYYGYTPTPHKYLKLYFGSAAALTAARFALLEVAGSQTRKPVTTFNKLRRLFPDADTQAIEQCLKKAARAPYSRFGFTLAEANIEHHNQFCADKGINPGKWVRVAAKHAWFESIKNYYVEVSGIEPTDSEGSAPIRTLAFDLEVHCKDLGHVATKFYDGDDPHACILCVSSVHFNYVDKRIEGCVFALGGDDTPPETPSEQHKTSDGSATIRVHWSRSEKDVILAFLRHLKEYDPDIVTGWNTLGNAKAFDWMYLYKRCVALGLLDALKSVGRWGRAKFFVDDNTGLWSERARVPIVMPGRTMHDMMLWTKRNKNLREYNLNYVAEIFRCSEKDDVSYNKIEELSKTHQGRVKLAVYCELDSRLVCKLMLCKALDPIGKTVSLAAITGCPLEDLLFKGSMNSLRLCLLRVSRQHGFVLSCPSTAEPEPPAEALENDVQDDNSDPTSRYVGGKVLAPVVGYYSDPVVTLDFGHCCNNSLASVVDMLKCLGIPRCRISASSKSTKWFRY